MKSKKKMNRKVKPSARLARGLARLGVTLPGAEG